MAGRNKRKEIRDGFHRELHKHIGMLKREFDKVETIVMHAHRVQADNEEIMALQDLKDAKIRLLRIRFNHEADLIVEEFKNRVQDILDRDGLVSSDLNVDDFENNGDGKEGNQGKTRRGDKSVQRGKRDSKTDDKNTTSRKNPKQRAGKRTRTSDGADKTPDNDAEQAANIERSKRFLKSKKNEAKQPSDSERTETECDEAGKPGAPERRLGTIRLKHGPNNSRRLVVEMVEPNEDRGRESTTSGKDGDEAGPSKAAVESNKEEQEDDSQENAQKTVRRSGRERKQTPKARESKRTARTRANR